MSTYWGYVCQSHDPELESERWFNHGEDVLRDAFTKERAGAWPNDPDITYWEQPLPVVGPGGAYETKEPIEWLRFHSRCAVALRSEYGDTEKL